jgi:hypothetical protein
VWKTSEHIVGGKFECCETSLQHLSDKMPVLCARLSVKSGQHISRSALRWVIWMVWTKQATARARARSSPGMEYRGPAPPHPLLQHPPSHAAMFFYPGEFINRPKHTTLYIDYTKDVNWIACNPEVWVKWAMMPPKLWLKTWFYKDVFLLLLWKYSRLYITPWCSNVVHNVFIHFTNIGMFV